MIELPASVRLIDEEGGLPFLRINAPGGSGDVYLQGAQIASWTPRGQRPVLWMSDASRFRDGQPIRGGIPLCFPWFKHLSGHPDAPQHGFARILPWTLETVREHGDNIELTLTLSDSPMTRNSAWPFRFELTLTVTLGRELRLELRTTNRDVVPFAFEEAFHTYFAVGDVCHTHIRGLEGLDFLVDGEELAVEDTPLMLGPTGVGRRYVESRTGVISDGINQRTITIDSNGSHGVVVWNPGPDSVQSLNDFPDNAWSKMICFETCNLGNSAIQLDRGEEHRMVAQLTVNPSR